MKASPLLYAYNEAPSVAGEDDDVELVAWNAPAGRKGQVYVLRGVAPSEKNGQWNDDARFAGLVFGPHREGDVESYLVNAAGLDVFSAARAEGKSVSQALDALVALGDAVTDDEDTLELLADIHHENERQAFAIAKSTGDMTLAVHAGVGPLVLGVSHVSGRLLPATLPGTKKVSPDALQRVSSKLFPLREKQKPTPQRAVVAREGSSSSSLFPISGDKLALGAAGVGALAGALIPSTWPGRLGGAVLGAAALGGGFVLLSRRISTSSTKVEESPPATVTFPEDKPA